MPEISLTDFVDFVVRAGPAKVTKVREIRERGEYSPAFDFWKPLREGIIAFHRSVSPNKRDLDRLLKEITDFKKAKRHPGAVSAYKKFLGKKKISWFEPPGDVWLHAGLAVRINPELGLSIDGRPTVAKLYFKDEARRQDHLHIVSEAMRIVLEIRSPPGAAIGVLDVGRSRLVTPKARERGIAALLAGEAASFVEIWKILDGQPNS